MADNKVMIIDDNKEFLNELKETLNLCGYKTIAVSDSLSAPIAARKMKPDCIILDLKMDKMNGFQVAEELKRSGDTRAIPIIAMSGYFPVENASALLDLSKMSSQIKKPFSVSDLITALEKVLN